MKPENNKDYLYLHRKILQSSIFEDPEVLKVWIWCLCKASYKKRTTIHGKQKVDLEEGDFIYGRKSAGSFLGMNEHKVYRTMNLLKECGNLSIKSHNKFSVVSVTKWVDYQKTEAEIAQQNEQQTSSKRAANEQQTSTNNKVKKEKKVKKITHVSEFAQEIAEIIAVKNEKSDIKFKPDRKTAIHKWAIDIDKINRVDGYELQKIVEVTVFACNDKFWKGVVLSGSGLRRNFDKILVKCNASNPRESNDYAKHIINNI